MIVWFNIKIVIDEIWCFGLYVIKLICCVIIDKDYGIYKYRLLCKMFYLWYWLFNLDCL